MLKKSFFRHCERHACLPDGQACRQAGSAAILFLKNQGVRDCFVVQNAFGTPRNDIRRVFQ
jgi:hypothetical protein